MASTPPTNEAFLREVDEELRRDQLIGYWRRYGRLTIAAVVLALAALGGWLWWQEHLRAQAGVAGEQLAAAIDDLEAGRDSAGAKLAPLAGAKQDGVQASARLSLAALTLSKGDAKGAAAQYAAIAADTSLDQAWRDLATVRGTAAAFDTLKPQEVVSRLSGLAAPGGPWAGSAGEMVAIAWLQMGKADLAAAKFAAIAADEGVPASIRSRAVQMSGLLGTGATPAVKGEK